MQVHSHHWCHLTHSCHHGGSHPPTYDVVYCALSDVCCRGGVLSHSPLLETPDDVVSPFLSGRLHNQHLQYLQYQCTRRQYPSPLQATSCLLVVLLPSPHSLSLHHHYFIVSFFTGTSSWVPLLQSIFHIWLLPFTGPRWPTGPQLFAWPARGRKTKFHQKLRRRGVGHY